MGDNNLLAAYKLINSQLVLSNQKLKEEIKEKVEMINGLNAELMQYRIENKTLRDMVQKLLEQFKMVTKIMGSVRDQSESVFNTVFNEHAKKEHEQQTRGPVAEIFYEKRRAERQPYVDEAAIEEAEDENHSMEDYEISAREGEETAEELGDEEEEIEDANSTPSKSPLVKRLGKKSRNRSFDESFETIDTNRVVKAMRKSQEYIQRRDSRDGRQPSDEESLQEKSEKKEETDTSNVTLTAPVITIDATSATIDTKGQITIRNSTQLEVSSFSSNSGVSDQSTQSDLNPTTDQSLRPVSIKRMASDSMLTTLIEREANKENSFVNNDTISNAASSTPVVKKRGRPQKPKPSYPHGIAGLSPVPFVSLKPLTKQNLSQHDISFEAFANGNDLKKPKIEDTCSEHNSIESNESGRPRRKAAPKTLKEPKINVKQRRT